MKPVVLSADGERKVYSVPDVVADNLRKYCIYFADNWLWNSPEANKYRTPMGVCFNENDFIDYLNLYAFPEEKSVLIKSLGWIDFGSRLPEPYCNYPQFNF